jgi:HPt (histidine-containing phosphotransfer) domain-containing protein
VTKKQELGRQMAEIGTRFLQRTLLEVDELRDLFAAAHGGGDEQFVAMAHLAHRIHGAGGMFGFDAVSDCALTLQQLVVEPSRDAAFMAAVQAALQALEEQVRAAVAAPRSS